MMGWKVWAADGSTMTSDQNDWSEVEDGVQVLMLYFEDHRQIIMGEDEFFNPENGNDPRLGMWLSDDAFDIIIEDAMNDDWQPA